MKTAWIFDFLDYKEFYQAWVQALGPKSHGEYRRLAGALDVSSTLISQIFKGQKNLSLEMACEFAEYLALNDNETEYLLLLVEHAKAGSYKLQSKLLRQLKRTQSEARKIERRMQNDASLNDVQQSVFYSNYLYSAVRLLTDLPDMSDDERIAQHLGVPVNVVKRILEFLLENGLCAMKGGRLKLGPTRSHIGSSSPLVAKHHQNWRLLGLQKMLAQQENHVFFTGPMTLSKNLADEFSRELADIIANIMKRVGPSPSETARCLNIDWFEF